MKGLILAMAFVGGLWAQDVPCVGGGASCVGLYAPQGVPQTVSVRRSGLRKGLAVGACVASAFDAGTTAWAMKVPGLAEGGTLGRGGRPLWLSLSLVKGVGCGVGLWFAWHPRNLGRFQDVPLFGSAASIAVLGGVGFHNWGLIRKAEGK